MKKGFLLFLSLVAWGFLSSAEASELHHSTHDVLSGGRHNIPYEAIVEGSAGHGGLQPDYLVDANDKEFEAFLAKARAIGKAYPDFWQKIDAILHLIDGEVFMYVNYKNPYYLSLIKRARQENRPVKLSEYLSCKAGVCREFALFTHFALKEAGIPNDFVYAKIQRASGYYQYNIVEDHAFTVVKHNGTEWVIDPYYWGFNGFKLADLLSERGITARSKAAPIASPGPEFRRIVRINNYPRVWVPKPYQPTSCRLLLASPALF